MRGGREERADRFRRAMTEEQSLRRAGCHPWHDETLTRSPDCIPVHPELSTAFAHFSFCRKIVSRSCVGSQSKLAGRVCSQGIGTCRAGVLKASPSWHASPCGSFRLSTSTCDVQVKTNKALPVQSSRPPPSLLDFLPSEQPRGKQGKRGRHSRGQAATNSTGISQITAENKVPPPVVEPAPTAKML